MANEIYPQTTAEELAPRLSALGNITRLAIYRRLVRAGLGGMPVSSIQEHLDIPASTLSHHLRKLVEVGLVTQERQATTLLCSADFSVMEATFALFAKECCIDDESCSSDDNSCC